MCDSSLETSLFEFMLPSLSLCSRGGSSYSLSPPLSASLSLNFTQKISFSTFVCVPFGCPCLSIFGVDPQATRNSLSCHSEKDLPSRAKIVSKIATQLVQLKPNAPEKWKRRVRSPILVRCIDRPALVEKIVILCIL